RHAIGRFPHQPPLENRPLQVLINQPPPILHRRRREVLKQAQTRFFLHIWKGLLRSCSPFSHWVLPGMDRQSIETIELQREWSTSWQAGRSKKVVRGLPAVSINGDKTVVQENADKQGVFCRVWTGHQKNQHTEVIELAEPDTRLRFSQKTRNSSKHGRSEE